MYAEGTSISHSSKDVTQLNTALNEELRRLDRWLKGNKLSLNVAKNRSMLITTIQKKKFLTASNQALQLFIREEHLEILGNTKHLGVQIDESLTWENQVKSVTEKASRAIAFLKYAKHFLPEAIVKTLYTSIIEPHLQSCCSVLGCCVSTEILQLQRLQSRAARIVTNSHFDAPSKPLIQGLGWKTIEDFINRQVNLAVFKC